MTLYAIVTVKLCRSCLVNRNAEKVHHLHFIKISTCALKRVYIKYPRGGRRGEQRVIKLF